MKLLVVALTAGPLTLYAILMWLYPEWTTTTTLAGFTSSGKLAGGVWQYWMLLQALIAIGIAISHWGKLRLGDPQKPERSYLSWIALMLCTLLAGGGVFWSAAEPLYHFQSVPPLFTDVQAKSPDAVAPALAQCYLHWGTLAWCSVASLGAIVLSFGEKLHQLPLKPQSLLWPLFNGSPPKMLGAIIDSISIVAVVAGTVGPIGFLALQLSSAGEQLFAIPNSSGSQLSVLAALVLLFSASAASGLDKGIAWLSRLNVALAIILGAALLILGQPLFVANAFFESMLLYAKKGLSMSLYREDTDWLSFWTVFYWGWFLGYAPIMSAFVARISRGRSVRELIVAVIVVAPLLTHMWFAILGGTGLGLEVSEPGVITTVLAEQGMASTLIAIVGALPLAPLWIGIALLLVFCFLATTADSMAYAISVVITEKDTPPISHRLSWAFGMGLLTALLLLAGNGSINALQQFIVVTAVPVTLILLPTAITAPLALRAATKNTTLQTD